MKKLLCYLTEYKKECVLGPLFKLLEASFELLVPLVMAAIIDVGIPHKDQGYVVRMCLVMVGLGLVGLVCSITAQYFAAKASVGFAAKLRRALFGHIQSLSYTELDTAGTATLITRMTSDINQVQNGMNLALRLLLAVPPLWCSGPWSWPLPSTGRRRWCSWWPSPCWRRWSLG